MQIWEAATLGLLQGLTEFPPISSSAHLRIAGEVLPAARDPDAAFTAISTSAMIVSLSCVLCCFRPVVILTIPHRIRPVCADRAQTSVREAVYTEISHGGNANP